MKNGLLGRALGPASRGVVRLLSRMRSDGILPVDLLRTIRRLAVVPNALLPPNTPIDGSSVTDPQLARMLRGTELGVWSLGPKSIDFLGDLVSRHKPDLVVEFGSGVSTLALAHFLSTLGPQGGVRLIALEQDAAYADQTRQLLRDNGFAESTAVIHAPLQKDVIEGKATVRYSSTPEFQAAVGGRFADLILIDGPVAETGGRFATLPAIRPFARRATFVMDDAIRDSELETAADWSRLPYIHLAGIKPIEKGLLLGSVGD